MRRVLLESRRKLNPCVNATARAVEWGLFAEVERILERLQGWKVVEAEDDAVRFGMVP